MRGPARAEVIARFSATSRRHRADIPNRREPASSVRFA
jgi:hypothetical protein